MTPIDPGRFDEFFEALNGYRPFRWQRRLLAHVLAAGSWPDVIDAPTGSGKSSVIDVHVFVNAVAASGGADVRVPRRLALTVDRRALVDGHGLHAADVARALRHALDDSDAARVLADAAEALAAMRGPRTRGAGSGVLDVATLRGGVRPSRTWLDDPTACQVIAATPEMWGSRLLFNGYGSTRWAHPREAGLLALDSVIVVDEAHLNHQLLTTARRVRDLAAGDARRLGVPGLQVTSMSATAASDTGTVVGVDEHDLLGPEHDELLAMRLLRPKPVQLRETEHHPAASTAAVGRLADVIVDEVLDLLTRTMGTVGCVVNTVRLAVEVSARLSRATISSDSERPRAGQEPTVEPIVGRMRPYDTDRLRRDHPDLFRHGGDASVDVVVATQTVEVGVDMDFAGLVTELAPGTSLAQRAGRVNRSGERAGAPITVIVPADPAALEKAPGPYEPDDLLDALLWLRRRVSQGSGLAPWSIHPRAGGDAPPVVRPRRPTWHRVEPWNVRDWARTSDDLFAQHELELWLDDDLDPDLMAGLVVREGLPPDAASARAQVLAAPPQRHEVFPVRVNELRAVIDTLTRAASDGVPRSLLIRADDVLLPGEPVSIRPGDIAIIDATTKAFTSKVVTADGPDDAPDVAELEPRTSSQPTNRTVRVGHGTPIFEGTQRDSAVLAELHSCVSAEDWENDEAGAAAVHDILRAWLASSPDTEASATEPGATARGLLRSLLAPAGSPAVAEVILSPIGDEPDDNFWVVIAGLSSVATDDEMRQVWTPRATGVVDLATHQAAVAAAADSAAARLHLADAARRALVDAALLHDEGKGDQRFQHSLRHRPGAHPGVVLAKSGMRSTQLIRRAREASGLPSGWRHEQLSVVITWSQLTSRDPVERDLVTRLVGTSHGRGRFGFDHTAADLLGSTGASEAAVALFDDAEWDLVVERTHARWGIWGIAYLEAILRAADGTTSRSGS